MPFLLICHHDVSTGAGNASHLFPFYEFSRSRREQNRISRILTVIICTLVQFTAIVTTIKVHYYYYYYCCYYGYIAIIIRYYYESLL